MLSFSQSLVAHESQGKALPEYRLSQDAISGSYLVQYGGTEGNQLLADRIGRQEDFIPIYPQLKAFVHRLNTIVDGLCNR